MKLVAIILFFNMGICVYPQTDRYETVREKMVNDLINQGITDSATLNAMRKVPRHLFVPEVFEKDAYDDYPVPIGYGQTISMPYVVALMTEVVYPEKGMKALEIGTGSGYQAAVLAEIVDTVYTIEIVPDLAWESGEKFNYLGYKNIVSKFGDGYKGWPEHAPFDIIVVTAAPEEIPQPLIDQLAENGRLVVPIPIGGPSAIQELILLVKIKGKIETRQLTLVMFSPLERL